MDVISRAAAKVRGLKHYFTGKQCKYGHVTKRRVSSGHCCGCTPLYRENNSNKVRETNRLYRKKNCEKVREWDRLWRKNNPEKACEKTQRWRRTNIEKAREGSRECKRRRREADPEKERKYAQEYRRRCREADPEKYREAVRERDRRWRKNNPEKVRERYCRRDCINRTDPTKKLVLILRRRVSHALKRTRKSKRTMQYVGCTSQFLYTHLSRLMVGTDFTWENFGTVWHIDHVWPIASFDLDNECDRLFVFNWSNLRPLAKLDNMRKGARPPTYTEFYDHYSAFVGPAEFW